MLYVLLDPIARGDSGISAYVRYAEFILKNNGIQVMVISRQENESIELYRTRVALLLRAVRKSKKRIVVEAPETDATTVDIPENLVDIHIRLHCSRQLGSYIQAGSINRKDLELEQREISRAKYISAPSRSAVAASRVLFDLPEYVQCYPNPGAELDNQIVVHDDAKVPYVLFVGRFHHLKGANWIPDFAKRFPEIPFLMVGPKQHEIGTRGIIRNLHFADGGRWDKRYFYRNARLVVIPSLYETASMVGIEALMAGRPIVSWAHLGIAEYASEPRITLVEPFNIDGMAFAIQEKFHSHCFVEKSGRRGCYINRSYLKGIRATLSHREEECMPIERHVDRMSSILAVAREISKNSMNNQSNIAPWRRKLRKLRRDPVLFFKDSRMIRQFGIGANDVVRPVIGNIATPLGIERPKVAAPPKTVEVKAKPASKDNSFCRIERGGRIEFREPPDKPEGLITALLSAEGRKKEVEEIISLLDRFEDFRYVRRPFLQAGTFTEQGDQTPLGLVERIDLKNKRLISAVDHIVLIDPPGVIVEALRACGTRQRIIVVLCEAQSQIPDIWHTDVLIIVGKEHPAVTINGWRRKIVVSSIGQVHIAIRRAIQEGVPKNPDMILPLMGFDGNHRDEFLRVNTKFHQGIILSNDNVVKHGPLEDIYKGLAKAMTAIAVTEGVYLRYRTLCDQIENLEMRVQFLSLALYDGVLFDVRS
jgi:glycosyltransferase involved in cell wall biosynthesis